MDPPRDQPKAALPSFFQEGRTTRALNKCCTSARADDSCCLDGGARTPASRIPTALSAHLQAHRKLNATSSTSIRNALRLYRRRLLVILAAFWFRAAKAGAAQPRVRLGLRRWLPGPSGQRDRRIRSLHATRFNGLRRELRS